MRIQYNAPVTLSFTFICAAFMVLKSIGFDLTFMFNVAPFGQMGLTNPLSYFRLFSHVIGHGGWDHYLGNFTYILLLGPILEEKYGSKQLLIMMLMTALITGLINAIFLSSALLGASGIVFMLILLSSVVNVQKGSLPLTFILVVVVFLGQEVVNSFSQDNISQMAHLMGGVCGAIFGFGSDRLGSR
ncbi:rhomboid family intramembrane serine protease [Flammeovirga sp. MY04]|uniref:rhomboid family intramembrane serine protease n=1 Tax=Flammeovirga sp. MY04 TaxID=1191459 RepID=UPI0008064290|nr:rhomboid family intramembrane serine protease [Flammeovirga sp. MY04]ANQ47787.1 rhomboid family intramembrane serine protease [Flammeovirga sp. MY04]